MATKEVERGGITRRWLRALFLEDWTLKALALLVTLGLWYAVTTQRAPATKRLHDVPLEFLLPDNVDIGNDPLNKVDVMLEGSQDKLAVLTSRDLVAQVDVTSLQPGDRNPRLTEKNFLMELPEGVRILEVTPRSLTLHLEPVVEREVPVEARFEGEPPEGFARGPAQVAPESIRVRGPQSHVAAVERAFTETISLAGRREPLTLPQVAIDIPDHKVVPLDATVSVRVEIGEEQKEQRFPNVAVRPESGGAVSPAAASVTLRGPRSVVEALRPEDVRLVVTPGEDGKPVARLALPPSAQGRVELVNTSPSEFTFNR
ncbi:MAG: YbbR-like domain-containing protein [Acidobacteria bacterium]|nr:YbbR-like domain-containing protein [Acidobacteriota bacterium]